MRFGDRLKENGLAYYCSSSSSSFLFDASSHLARAYETAGTIEGFKKAAAIYLELVSEYGDDNADHYLFIAAGALINAKEFEIARKVALRLAERKNIALAIQIVNKTDKKADFATLEQFALAAMKDSAKLVRETILKYLGETNNDLPFSTNVTYWFRSRQCIEYHLCVDRIKCMAGRFDNYPGTYSIAKYLYASDKAVVIEAIYKALRCHLIVGWMLSGISFEKENGVDRYKGRKYTHASFAAWRSFDEYMNHNDLYNNKNNDIGLPNDARVEYLHKYLESVEEEWLKLQKKDANSFCEDTPASDRFVHDKLAEMQEQTRVVYKAVSKEIEGLVAQL